MNENQGNEIISLLKVIIEKLNTIEENSSDNKNMIEDILFKLDRSTIL